MSFKANPSSNILVGDLTGRNGYDQYLCMVCFAATGEAHKKINVEEELSVDIAITKAQAVQLIEQLQSFLSNE
ncbi:hypothetical protein [Anabaena azotica]|uniref:Uncharacterized protein n=1 Tax=Anabaena azotica FACHB-119 TaxID=947527 RepID=A0ABR8DCH3_9NOST|nr:hypothetical protein [Anabaena azotica]MBD2503917.1 hypothetical protein [Anabaena azotica FACHB-119]